jgi:uncharacterized membrane protein
MGKIDYLEALKRAMTGLPPEAQAKTLAFYEQRFVDGVAAGKTEQDVAAELDDPKKIAMTLRASTHMQAFETKKNPANLVRMVVAALGLAVFNLFMVVPAMVYAALLATMYVCGLSFYLAGSVITASGLSGANEIKLDGPLRNVFANHATIDGSDDLDTKVNISEQGIHIFSERSPNAKARSSSVDAIEKAAIVSANAAATAAERAAEHAGRVAEQAGNDAERAAEQAGHAAEQAADRIGHAAEQAARQAGQAAERAAQQAGHAAEQAARAAEEAATAAEELASDDEQDDQRSVRVIKRAESVASKGITISTDADDESRATQTLFGFLMVLGGIVLLLISLAVTRYTFIGLKRYIEINFSLLRGH